MGAVSIFHLTLLVSESTSADCSTPASSLIQTDIEGRKKKKKRKGRGGNTRTGGRRSVGVILESRTFPWTRKPTLRFATFQREPKRKKKKKKKGRKKRKGEKGRSNAGHLIAQRDVLGRVTTDIVLPREGTLLRRKEKKEKKEGGERKKREGGRSSTAVSPSPGPCHRHTPNLEPTIPSEQKKKKGGGEKKREGGGGEEGERAWAHQ